MKQTRLCTTSVDRCGTPISKAVLAPVLTLALAVLLLSAPAIQAQTFHLLHPFTGGSDEAYPYAAPILDRGGNLYGTTFGRSNGGVYELSPHGSSWIFKSLYNFQATNDGRNPSAPVVFGPDGTLYGTTAYGGNTCFASECGTVFNLRPPARFCGNANCPWTEHPVYWFGGTQIHDGYRPSMGPLVFDPAGNIYGTTTAGGLNSNGSVYQLFRTQNGWGEAMIDAFMGHGLPAQPKSGVTLDAAGNVYGTSPGYTYGDAYAVLHSGQGWSEQTIYIFQGGSDGGYPQGGLIFDAAGNAYGTTKGNAGTVPGTVFQLTPQGDGTWTETVLHVFRNGIFGPTAKLAMDAAGNLYGTTEGIGSGGTDRFGSVFKLAFVDGSWVFTNLYTFTDGEDGIYPVGGVTLDAAGNLYGTCSTGGAHNFGTVWEITP